MKSDLGTIALVVVVLLLMGSCSVHYATVSLRHVNELYTEVGLK